MSRSCDNCSAPLAAASAFGGGQRCRVCGKSVPGSEELCVAVASRSRTEVPAAGNAKETHHACGFRKKTSPDLQLQAMLEQSLFLAKEVGEVVSGRTVPNDIREITDASGEASAEREKTCISLEELRSNFDELRMQCRFTEILQLIDQYPNRAELQGFASRIMEVRYLQSRQENAWKSLGSSQHEAGYDAGATEQYLDVLEEMQLVDEEFLAAMQRFRRPSTGVTPGSLLKGVRIPGSLIVGLITTLVYFCLPAMLESLRPGSRGVTDDRSNRRDASAESDALAVSRAEPVEGSQRDAAALRGTDASDQDRAVSAGKSSSRGESHAAQTAVSGPILLPGESQQQSTGELRIRQVESETLQMAADVLAAQDGSLDGASVSGRLAMLAAQTGPIEGGLTQEQLALLLAGIQGGDVECELIVPLINAPQQHGLSAEDAALLRQGLQDGSRATAASFAQQPDSRGLKINCDLVHLVRETAPEYEHLAELDGNLAEGTRQLALEQAKAGEYHLAFATLNLAAQTLGRNALTEEWLYIEASLVADTRRCLLQRDGSNADRYLKVIRDWCPNREEDVRNGLQLGPVTE